MQSNCAHFSVWCHKKAVIDVANLSTFKSQHERQVPQDLGSDIFYTTPIDGAILVNQRR